MVRTKPRPVQPEIAIWAVTVDVENDSGAPSELSGLPVEPVRLKEAERDAWAEQLARRLEAAHGKTVIAWLSHYRAVAPLRALTDQVSNLLVARTPTAVEGAVELLREGRSLASLVHPPLPIPDRVFERSGLEPEDAGDTKDPKRWRVELVEGPGGSDRAAAEDATGTDWLALTPDGVRVRTDALRPVERAAVAERVGLHRARLSGDGSDAAHDSSDPAHDGRDAAHHGRNAPSQGSNPGRRDQAPTGNLVIGSANYAGQGRAWAQAVSDHVPGFRASNLQLRTPSSLVFDADCLVPSEIFADPVARLDLALDLFAPATHVLVEDMRGLMGLGSVRNPVVGPEEGRRECERILESGRRVACLVHGTAGRTPATHRSMYPWSPYHDLGAEFAATRVDVVERVVAALDGLVGSDVPVFTATPDMLDFLPGAVWLPIVASRADFAPSPPWAPGGKLRVAHAPSSDVLKGSEFVDAALTDLADRGVIDYVSVRGVAPILMPRLLRQVDVVVDQVVLGNPATLLIQTMAAGRLAVAHAAPSARRRYGEPLPVVEADPSSIAEAVADIAADPDRYRGLAQAGPDFARRFHDGRLSAEILESHFLRSGSGER
ncbi:MAG: hypothetical protein LBK95_05480 [Bifidobacteriaceae bacterium]|jgi:hypothetical protein|nr:hypothetical protein [Bifidobacteriaceae bacterium]